jgi:ribA/ribD-fused uncharacterized protein
MTIYFYSQQEKPYGCFSNFSRHGVDLDGKWWPTVEHYFQAQKFVGTPFADKVREAATPKDAARLGRNRAWPLRKDWEQVKDDVMLRALLRKFELHADVRQILLSTGEEELVENAPKDYYWGCGAQGTGLNKLGLLLVQVRTQLRQNATEK